MIVMSGIETTALDLPDVIRISPIAESFLERLDGRVDLGATAKKANNERTYNLAATATYRTRKYRLSTSLNSFFSDRTDTLATRRSDFNITYSRKLRDKWFWTAATRLDNNEELNLDLRTALVGGGGRFLIQSNRTLMSWTAALAGNREWYIGADEAQDNLEAALGLDYQLFVFGTRETDITITLFAFPSITTWGRVRSSLDAKFKHEFVSDLYFSIGILADYDSQPPTGTESEKIDWNLTTSIGYSW
jgi:hypothetical protein